MRDLWYRILKLMHRIMLVMLHIERRLEPWFRPQLNRLLREPNARLIQFLINLRRRNEGLGLAEERIDPDEERSLDEIIDLMADQMRGHFRPGGYERGGNTKTHGIVRAEVTILDDLPERCRRGCSPNPEVIRPMSATPDQARTYPPTSRMSVSLAWRSS